MAGKGYSFEFFVKKGLENYLAEFDIKGRVRREFQRMPNYRGLDITVDSPIFYSAFECKSRTTKGHHVISCFHTRKDGTNQFDVISEYLADTGRAGYLVVELKPPLRAYVIPWRKVRYMHEDNGSFPIKWIRSFPEIEKLSSPDRGYRFTPEMF